MWSNQYLKERFFEKDSDERELIGCKYRETGIARDRWQKDFQQNRRFLVKYSAMKYELTSKRDIRNKKYTKHFHSGTNLMVEYGVNISRQHYLEGTIVIGNNVLLAKNVFIDYSGDVVIKDDVRITNGVIIETHYHHYHSDYTRSRSEVVPTSLVIEEGAVVGSRAIIMASCHYIGKYARIGAGAVVTHDVPDYAVAVGVPAKVVRCINQ